MKLHAALGLALCLVGCLPSEPEHRAPGNPVSNPADEKARAGVATVIIHYPAGWGHGISVRGSGAGLAWSRGQAASWTPDDAWTLSLRVTTPIELKPLFDDTDWAKGANWVLAPGQTIDIWPHFFHDGGRLERSDGWYSQHLDDTRTIVVYLPPSYDENPRARYPVIYMHDGQNLFDDDLAFGGVSWNVAGAMDQGVASGSIGEAIVVGVDNDSDRLSEYVPAATGDDYLAFVADELKPVIDRRYRTLGDRDHTGILGSSLGGLISAYAGVARAETFGLMGALSPSTWWNDGWIIDQVRNAPRDPVRVYIDSGDAGSAQDGFMDTAKLAQAYRDRGANLRYLVQHGAMHNEYWWRQRLPGALEFLVGPR